MLTTNFPVAWPTPPMPLASIFEEAASNTLPNGDELVAAGAPHDMRFAQPV